MSFTFCNEHDLENSKRWIKYLDAKAESCKEIYEKCIQDKLKQCHLILDEYNQTLRLRGNISTISEAMDLKCQIERDTLKRLE